MMRRLCLRKYRIFRYSKFHGDPNTGNEICMPRLASNEESESIIANHHFINQSLEFIEINLLITRGRNKPTTITGVHARI